MLIVTDILIQGDLFTTEVLDSETRNLYSLVVQAQDNSSAPNSAYTTVIFTKWCVLNTNVLTNFCSAGDNCCYQCE